MNKNIIIFAIMATCILGACDDMNSINQKYYDEGEQIYITIPDSLTVIPGNQRAKVKWYIDADPKIKDCVISWSDKDSVIVPMEGIGRGKQWKETIINNLPEGSLIFTAYIRDIYGNHSLVRDKSQMIYGPEYIARQSQRKIESMDAYLTGNVLKMTWNTLENSVGVNIHYRNKNNEEKTVKVDGLQTSVELNDFVIGGKFTYETLYQPYEKCLDIMTTASAEGKFPSLYILTDPEWKVTLSDKTDQEGGGPETLLDNNLDTYWHNDYSTALSHWAQIDMTKEYEIHEVQINKRKDNTDCKEIEVRTSQDGITFDTVGTIQFEKTASPNGKSLILEAPVKAKYLKCVITQSWRIPHASLSEIRVLGF